MGDQGHAVCVDHGTAHPLQEAEDEEQAYGGREDGEDGPGGVDHDPDHKDGDLPPGITEPSGREEEDDRREEVGAGDPGKCGSVGREFSADGRESEVDCGARERVQERGDGDQYQDEPS
jgi:hypothetical protein